MAVLVSSHNRYYTSPSVPRLTDAFPRVPISNGFSKAYGGSNIQVINGSMATLALDKSSGSGLVSVNKYHYGFFSAAIKLPAGLTSGVVVAFYLSNADVFPHNHDEIDIELLGHDKRNDWVIQTNVYANGSVNTGREEKFYLWFDPNTTAASIQHHLEQPSYSWATHGGKYPVNYKYAPFRVSFAEMEMSGCISNPTGTVTSCSKNTPSSLDPIEGPEFVKLSNQQISALGWARSKLMFYSYCKDTSRFKVMPPECK
ncbi:unnamed protein product [Prunus armeniaca]|uniref:Xyloglucan endotransglucosylase/hydrolase n=1 Tax=Prunus armeniaca TaxID=36596 RepID=A0A6J5W9Q5_PRUAR|nr:unnamed protein product [Prunus armeniaca]